MQSINGDLGACASVDTMSMDWSPSPSGTVWRKRVHRVGPPESGQVTSIVRYDPDSSFPAHEHPDGEEILVLDGVFSDEHGDWPAGTYLLNPEGFRHAPFSREGCTLFVKLRQYPGRDRIHVALRTRLLPWVPAAGEAGIAVKDLYAQDGYRDRVRLERWSPGAGRPDASYGDGAEIFVLDGALEDDAGRYPAGTWLRFPIGARHPARAPGGCELYVKRGGIEYLVSGGSETGGRNG